MQLLLELVLVLDEACPSLLLCTVWGYGIPSLRDGHAARKAQLGSLSKQPFGRGLYPLQRPQAGRCQALKDALVHVAIVHVQADVHAHVLDGELQ